MESSIFHIALIVIFGICPTLFSLACFVVGYKSARDSGWKSQQNTTECIVIGAGFCLAGITVVVLFLYVLYVSLRMTLASVG